MRLIKIEYTELSEEAYCQSYLLDDGYIICAWYGAIVIEWLLQDIKDDYDDTL